MVISGLVVNVLKPNGQIWPHAGREFDRVCQQVPDDRAEGERNSPDSVGTSERLWSESEQTWRSPAVCTVSICPTPITTF